MLLKDEKYSIKIWDKIINQFYHTKIYLQSFEKDKVDIVTGNTLKIGMNLARSPQQKQ